MRRFSRVAAWLKSGRAAGVPPVRLCRHGQDDARAPLRRGASTARSPSAPSPARPRRCCAARAATTPPPSTASSTGPSAVEDERPVLRHQPRERRPSKADLIVIDECSMVDEDLGRDLLSFGVPVLVLGDPGAAAARQGRRLLHRRRARHDADRGAPAGARQPDHPHVHGGARGRARWRSATTARAASSAAPTSTPRAVLRDRPGAGRHEPHAPPLQPAHPRAEGLPRSHAGRRRKARLPAQRQAEGPAQRRHLDGQEAARAAARGFVRMELTPEEEQSRKARSGQGAARVLRGRRRRLSRS